MEERIRKLEKRVRELEDRGVEKKGKKKTNEKERRMEE